MNIIWHALCIFLALITNYSYGRYTDRWVQTDDQALIDEALSKAFSRYDFGLDIDTARSKITKVICKTKVHNGIHIKLYFELDQRMWKCMLYKSLVQTLSITYDKCEQVADDKSSEEVQQKQSEFQMQDEGQPKEFDDEAEIDALSQNAETKTNDVENQVDDNNKKIEEKENVDTQNFEENDEDENDDGENVRTDDFKENSDNDNQLPEEDRPDGNMNRKDEDEQNQVEETNNVEEKPNEDEIDDNGRNK